MNIFNTSFEIKNIKLNNRLVMPPMATSKSSTDGKATQELFDYYDEKSKGGYIGLIITEHAYVTLEGKASIGQLSISDNSNIEPLKKLVSVIHQNGSKVIAQINHAGAKTKKEITGSVPKGPSINKVIGTDYYSKEMTIEDIKNVIEYFKKAALRVKETGFDGVEIHSAHGYLLNQFFSPLTNKREDEYNGNSINGRIKLHLEIIKAVREAVGNDFIVALRLGACDYIQGGTTIEDSITAVKEFQKAGIDFVDISGGICGYINPYNDEQGYFREITKAIKENINIPVILTGGITDAFAAEEILKNKEADLIGVGRAILKDSKWAENAVKVLR